MTIKQFPVIKVYRKSKKYAEILEEHIKSLDKDLKTKTLPIDSMILIYANNEGVLGYIPLVDTSPIVMLGLMEWVKSMALLDIEE